MITLWNRKEVLITYDMQKQSQVRALLQEQGIDYTIKTHSRENMRGHRGKVFQNPMQGCEYKIYVHKDDYEQAVRLINQR